ncbi:Uncharacterised ACR, YkgG family COG1556 [Dermatophilus congolensis]|uniref:Uncharacterized ACR, YkgG family COG1556 n=1 Tax=Dermatophilus congolensis TaxID=1863 RepID=A0A239VG98_9MICO|nr:LUD domain-containing protein [Dermatophilus congolensis]SNV20799.1 Uncharacterised ACR, YkgG family COG1556 [Dermatophilus congolensis]
MSTDLQRPDLTAGAPHTPGMSARDEILARIRQGLTDVPADMSPAEDTPVDWEYGQANPQVDDVVDRFVERVEDYRATVARCARKEIPAAIAEALRITEAKSVVLPEGIDASWRAAVEKFGVPVSTDGPTAGARTRAELNSTHAVVTAARAAGAESGTIMLDHAEDQGRRALTLLPDIHVCVVTTDQIVSDIPEATALVAPSLRAGNPVTWISGGSATSDIELSRVEGVHGPRTLYVIVAG